MALLEVRDLSVGIRRKKDLLIAVDRIGFSIGAGEITALVGESGCGKTLTALSIPLLLPREAEITGGRIGFSPPREGGSLPPGARVAAPHPPLRGPAPQRPAGGPKGPPDPPDSSGLPDLRGLGERELRRIRGRDISMIFQEPRQSLNPLKRIGSQITEALELHGMKDRKDNRKAALEMIERLGLREPEKIFTAYPHQLSGGMCQRVMIAIAAICRPRLLIADEPTTALDGAVQTQILALLREINRDYGTAILLISHDLDLVGRFCDRLLVMYAGKIVEEGPAAGVFADPRHPYTRGLSGAIPRRERRGQALANIPGRVPSIEDRYRGCPFAPRCSGAREKCREFFPGETDLGGGRRLHCFAPEAFHG